MTELGVRYHDLYRTARRLGIVFERHPTSRHFEVTHEAAGTLRSENQRIRALHERSIKIAVAARHLNLAVSTVSLMTKRSELQIDDESDSSDARFVTRESVEQYRIARSEKPRPRVFDDDSAVPLADVVRFTGRSRIELLDLVRSGTLEEVPGRGPCALTPTSLRACAPG